MDLRGLTARTILLVALIAGLGVAALGMHHVGWRAFAVTSPSMAQAAPVGTLVITAPTSRSAIDVGDLVTFRPPGIERYYTHRVSAVSAQGYRTRGDLNGADDPWLVSGDRIAGEVILRIWGGGWLVRGSFYLVGFGAVVMLIGRRLRPPRRNAWYVVGFSAALAVTSMLLRPWVNLQMVTFRGEGKGITASIVSTGIFPVRVSARGGNHVDLVAGQLGLVHTDRLDEHGRLVLLPSLHLFGWWWIAVAAFVLAPLLYTLLVGLPAAPVITDDDKGDDGFLAPLAGAAAVGLACLGLPLTPVQPTAAALTARVANSSDTAGSRTWITCRQAETGTAGRFLVYSLSGATTAGSSAPDLSGNGRNGTYSGTVTSSSAALGCVRDTPVASSAFTAGCVTTPTAASLTNPNVFSLEIWFKTTAVSSKLAGFGRPQTGTESQYDRQLYLDSTGRLVFGVYPGSVQTVTTTAPVNNGAWHHAIATLSASGMALYLDGTLVASKPAVSTGENYTGWWRFGCGNLSGWTGVPGGYTTFAGQLSYVAVYTVALTSTQVVEHYKAGTV